ncbi:MAG: NADPH-dependent F420 reductase [Nitrososphaerales archaeon]
MQKIGFIGGTGDLGTAIAIHLAKEYEILLGSRSVEKAQAAVNAILMEKGKRDYLAQNMTPTENEKVVETCKIILLTVPHENAIATIKGLAARFSGDQILISAVAPVVRVGKEFHSEVDASGKSVSQQIAHLVPKSVKVATAFQSVPAHILYEEKPISSDVLVACDELETYQEVAEIISKIEGLRPLYLGTLNLSGEIERLTALILNIAIKNKLKSPTPKFNSF